RLNGFLHVRSTFARAAESLKVPRPLIPLGEPRRPEAYPPGRGRQLIGGRQPGAPEPPRPPKIANGFPGTVSHTISPPASTSPGPRAASVSASSFVVTPTIR